MMRRVLFACLVGGSLVIAAPVIVAVDAQTPKGATAQCKDGTSSTAKTQRGACSGHGGVATWLGPSSAQKNESKPSAPKQNPRETKSVGTAGNASAPADATGRCKDGTYTTANSKRGACSGHGGVTTWFADEKRSATQNAPRSTAAERPAPAPPAPPAVTPTPTRPDSNAEKRPADAPPNATAQCNDGTYSLAKQHRGACSGHKGVKTWLK